MHGKSVCSLHLDLKVKDNVTRKFAGRFRESVLERSHIDIVGFNTDCYEVVFEEGKWAFSYLGKKVDTNFAKFGNGVGVGRIMFGGEGTTSKVGNVCKACFMRGREGCPRHMFNKDV